MKSGGSIPRIRRRGRKLVALAAASIGWLVCNLSSAGSLAGTANYRERIAVPADAVFEAELQDVALADAPAMVLGRAQLDPAGQPPFRFEISYEESAVRAAGRYVVRATVRQAGRLLFTTDRAYPVLDGRSAPLDMLLVSARGGAQAGGENSIIGTLPASYEGELPGASGPVAWHVDLLPEGRFRLRTIYRGQPEPNRFDDIGRWVQEGGEGRLALRGTRTEHAFLLPVDGGAALRKLDISGRPIDSSQHDRLARLPRFAPIEPRLRLTGVFSYLADAAGMTPCADGERLPVAMEADYAALEAAYRNTGLEPGQPLLAELEGRIAQRPSMEEGRPPSATLVVERFIAVRPGETCGNAPEHSSLGKPF